MNTVDRRINAKKTTSPPVTETLGQQLLEAGKLRQEDIMVIMEAQSRNKLRFGEAAVDLGLISERDIQEMLAKQYEYPVLPADGASFNPELVSATQPFSVQSEAIRGLRSQLSLRWLNDTRKVIAITSTRRGHGASAISANLAVAFAQLGERTLLIDANFRHPTQHHLFGLECDNGLSALLKGRCAFKDVVVPIPHLHNLHVMCAGPMPPNPQELLSRVGFSYLVETAPGDFDVVIVDTPPILEYADAQVVSARAGGCVLAVRRDATRVADVQNAKRLLEPAGATLLGAVVSD